MLMGRCDKRDAGKNKITAIDNLKFEDGRLDVLTVAAGRFGVTSNVRLEVNRN